MGVLRKLLGLQQLDRIEAQIADLRQMRAALEHAERRAVELERELGEERERVRELADQMQHLIEELGGTRYMWLEWKAKAADYDDVVAARDAALAELQALRGGA